MYGLNVFWAISMYMPSSPLMIVWLSSQWSGDGQSVRSVEQQSRQDLHLPSEKSAVLFYFRPASVADITVTQMNANRYAL